MESAATEERSFEIVKRIAPCRRKRCLQKGAAGTAATEGIAADEDGDTAMTQAAGGELEVGSGEWPGITDGGVGDFGIGWGRRRAWPGWDCGR